MDIATALLFGPRARPAPSLSAGEAIQRRSQSARRKLLADLDLLSPLPPGRLVAFPSRLREGLDRGLLGRGFMSRLLPQFIFFFTALASSCSGVRGSPSSPFCRSA